MIVLHRINGTEFLLNEDHIETMEETPDMIILLTNDRKYIVKEKRDEILTLIKEYKQKIYK